jgi:cephalosporin hydroxylase
MISQVTVRHAFRSLRSYLSPRRARRVVWDSWCREYDTNPFHINPANISRQTYLDLAAEVRNRTYPEFMASIERSFGFLPDREFVDDLALSTQVVIKKSKLLYLHGYLLYGALRHYLSTHPDEKSITILETGTARGFSALCMAKALQDAQRNGRIITVDVLHARRPIYWNCIHDAEGKKTRFQLLERWQDLVEDYVIFLRGHTDIVLQQLELARIHFTFLDSRHDYDTLSMELDFVAAHQRQGDVIVCDDYTPAQFPGVVRAVDELLAGSKYEGQVFTSEEGRGYMHCRQLAD